MQLAVTTGRERGHRDGYLVTLLAVLIGAGAGAALSLAAVAGWALPADDPLSLRLARTSVALAAVPVVCAAALIVVTARRNRGGPVDGSGR
ncbi:hypothetical protein [Curtobacterium sp. ER1/6]|uniref:hypothetical protein n=1 Tax=Curtobacterium sp. ER1/6 TaxID=1891920 RepID=UPI00086A19DE|nr:hypothetical protein [Curtobacterium sp. ER1/6]OEI67222.1 hypothetical protein Cus16_3181 [Curtobacterium sp. ER1/6]